MLTMENWKCESLGRVVTLQRGYDLPHRLRKSGAVPIITSSGFETTHCESRAPAPGVVTGRYGTIGRVFYVAEDFWPLNTTLYVRDFHGNNPRFIYHLLQTIDYATHSGKSGVPGVNRNDLHLLEVCVPPTIGEQEAIAGALSDADALIESLEELLAKKRDIKHGVMQEMLTGKRRLPGFTDTWNKSSLAVMTSRSTGFWGMHSAIGDKAVRVAVIRAGDITADGRLVATAARFFSEAEVRRAACRLDDLVITASGNGLGKIWWCDGRPDVAASNFVRILRPRIGQVSGRFLAYALKTTEGERQLAEHTATSAYPNLRPSYFTTEWIPTPAVAEQTAIAAVLSDMDAELCALEAKLAKARKLKLGMMQELLTGRIRLVEPE